MTRAPAKPTSALGSARITSPSEAYDASTPAVEGSVRIETNGSRSSCSRASSAEVLAICMSERMPSCMRAPPVRRDHDQRAALGERELDRARHLLAHHRAHAAAHEEEVHERRGSPACRRWSRTPAIAASFMPVSFWAAVEAVRVAHLGVAELERVAGHEVREALLERARVDQVAEVVLRRTRKWWSQCGQVQRFSSSTVWNSASPQPSHLVHRPSGTSAFSVRVLMPAAFLLEPGHVVGVLRVSTSARPRSRTP